MKFTSDSWLKNEAAQRMLGALENAGYQGYFVGGCVRNALLGLPVTDLDVATDARPEAVIDLAKELGFKAIPTGIEHGTVTVVGGDEPLEITTFRKDVETDGRHAVVAFADTLEEDAARRDFRMNALYADARGVLYDPTDGLADIKARKLVFVGEAEARIKEDYLRIIRLFRFAAQLEFGVAGIDRDALYAAGALSGGLGQISIERKTAEMLKLLAAPDPSDVLLVMAQANTLSEILPEYDLVTCQNFIAYEEEPLPLGRLAALTCATADQPLRLPKRDDEMVRKAKILVFESVSVAELAFKEGMASAELAIRVSAAKSSMAPSGEDLSAARFAAQQVFPVAAQDLMPKLSGKALGDTLKALQKAWIASGFKLSKQELLDRI